MTNAANNYLFWRHVIQIFACIFRSSHANIVGKVREGTSFLTYPSWYRKFLHLNPSESTDHSSVSCEQGVRRNGLMAIMMMFV